MFVARTGGVESWVHSMLQSLAHSTHGSQLLYNIHNIATVATALLCLQDALLQDDRRRCCKMTFLCSLDVV
jgi:hypothetical protein